MKKQIKEFAFIIGKRFDDNKIVKDLIIGPEDENLFMNDVISEYIYGNCNQPDISGFNSTELAVYVIFEPWPESVYGFYRLNNFLEDYREKITSIMP